MLLAWCCFLLFSRISYFAGKKMASIWRIPFNESVVKTCKGRYFLTQIKQYNSYTVNKCTQQGHSSPHNPYVFRKEFHTLTCTWTIGIGYPITAETYPVDSTRDHKYFSSCSVSIVPDFFCLGRGGWYPSFVSKIPIHFSQILLGLRNSLDPLRGSPAKPHFQTPDRASPVAWSPSGLPRETPFPHSCKKCQQITLIFNCGRKHLEVYAYSKKLYKKT